MADNTKIEWADATLNYVNGCTRISPGCGGPGNVGGCYAERLAAGRLRNLPSREGLAKMTDKGPRWTGKINIDDRALEQALRWRRPRRIFWNAHGDLFHDGVSDEAIDRLFAVCALTPHHTHMILTKRSKRMREYIGRLDEFTLYETPEYREAAYRVDCDDDTNGSDAWHKRTGQLEDAICTISETLGEGKPLPNVWLGVSIEDQQRADERRADFEATPAAVKFVSYEPALGRVDWTGWDFVHQIISGGESGPRARPTHPDWHRATRDFCQPRGIAYFFKQWGEWNPREWKADQGTHAMHRNAPGYGVFQKIQSHPNSIERTSAGDGWQAFALLGKKAAGRLLDGVEHNEFPQVRP